MIVGALRPRLRLRRALLASTALASTALAVTALAVTALAVAAVQPAMAQDATWLPNPGSGDYSTNANWSTGLVPSGTAFFDTSSITSLSFSPTITPVGGWTFNAGASAYSFTNPANLSLWFDGAGIAVNGGSATLTNNGSLLFKNSSSAGGATITNNAYQYFNDSSTVGSGNFTNNFIVDFNNSSSLGSATVTNNYFLQIHNTSSAGSANITNNSNLIFDGTSTGGSSTITNNGSAYLTGGTSAGSANITNNFRLYFSQTATADNATIANTSEVIFSGASTAGNAAITNTNNLLFYDTSAAGSATITNTFILSFYDTSTAGSAAITNNSGGYVTFNDSSTAGSSAVTNNGNLYFNGASTAGGSTLITNSGGITLFNNASSGDSARFIANAGGRFDFSYLTSTGTTAGSIEGAGRFNLGSATLTVGSNDLSTTVSGVIADGGGSGGTGGALVKVGNGTLTLTGANTYTGGTTINGGTLQIGDSTHTGKILGAVTNNTIFELVNADTSGITSIANSHTMQVRNSTSLGNIAITNSGFAIDFHNTSSAGSATITSTAGSGAAFFDASTAGNSTITGNGSNTFLDTSNAGSAIINGTGSISFLGGSSAANANITISGTGGGFFNGTATAGNATITFSGSSNLTFVDTSTAGSAHITNNGSMGFFFDSTAANAVITNTGGADLRFSNTTTASNATIINSGTVNFYNTASGGNARLIANAGGVFDFSSLTAAGTTAGSFEGAGSFRLGSRTLTIGGNGLSTNVTGVIADGGAGGGTGGALVKTGAGTMILSGINTYTGATTVDGGTLAVNGSITASSGVTVNNGGFLAGTGTVGNTTVNSGGTLAAGNGTAGSSLNVTGSLAFQSSAFYMVQLNPATSSATFVTGAATLGGSTVKAIYANGNYVVKQYTILTAASVSGTFASVAETNLPSNVHATLSYDATHAYLNLVLSFIPPPGSGLSGNQNAVGNAIVSYFNSNGGIPIIYSALTADGLTQTSGETAAGSQATTFQAMTQFMGVMTDPFSAGREAGTSAPPAFAAETEPATSYAASRTRSTAERDAYAMFAKAPLARAYEPHWSVWAAGFGGSQTSEGNTALGSNNTTSRLFGTAAGADYWFSAHTLAGFALAGGGTNFSVVNGGTGRSDLFQAGAFVRHSNGPAYISVALAYGWQDVTTDRTVTIAGVDRLRAAFNANAYSGRVEGGHRYVTPWAGGIGLTPYAAAQFTTFDLPAYAEQVISGANTFALAYGSKSVTDTRSELGLRADKSFTMTNAVLTLRGRAAWAHDFNPDRTIGATFQALPGASFVVNGARQASDSALTTASAEVKWLNGWSMAATFEGEFSNVTRSYAGKGVVRYAW
jgi:autotransporter-associated beta strand protein